MSSRQRPSSACALLAGVLVGLGGLGGCITGSDPAQPQTYVTDIGPLLSARCARCHGGPDAPDAGYRVTSYADVLGCASDEPAASGDDPKLLSVLRRPDHATLLTQDERDRIARWLAAGAPSRAGGVHGPSFADPRSPDRHGRFLRARGYRPMLEPEGPDACGVCHDGAPSRPEAVRFGAPGAPPCTSCHTEPDGALGCATCHGPRGGVASPRMACFAEASGAHRAHVEPSTSFASGLPCKTCHPTPEPRDIGGTHANGYVDVWFDYARAGRTASFDAASKRCSGTCHDRGGTSPQPAWTDGPARCNAYHASPPANHYAGACASCHREANAGGTALSSKVGPGLHLNGSVDLGDGSGTCAACHGEGERIWPDTGAHARHLAPASSRPVACATCHQVPAQGERHPTGRGFARVTLTGLAVRGGSRASFDPASKSCAETYCHSARGGTNLAPNWIDPPQPSCGACHASPPPPPHSPSSACAGSVCHQNVTGSDGGITAGGKSTHVDGIITRSGP